LILQSIKNKTNIDNNNHNNKKWIKIIIIINIYLTLFYCLYISVF
jgi:hypothetical protein